MAEPARMMRAAVLVAPRQAQLREVPRPEPGPGQALVRVEGCGICGSNLPVWEGRPWFDYPLPPGRPGHEGWGRVAALGAGVDAVREGERVAFLSERAFADYDLCDQRALLRLPASLDGADLPGEPLACAMNVWARCDVRAGDGQTVAIVGVGFLGAALLQLALRAGARVLALSRRSFSLQLARRLGAHEVIDLDQADDRLVEQVLSLTGGAGCERVIEATGHARPLALAARLCAVRGRLIIAGYHQDGPRSIDLQLWSWRGLDVINAHERDPQRYLAGMRAGIDALAQGRIDLAPLLTHRLPLAQTGAALELLASRPDGFVKAVVLPQPEAS